VNILIQKKQQNKKDFCVCVLFSFFFIVNNKFCFQIVEKKKKTTTTTRTWKTLTTFLKQYVPPEKKNIAFNKDGTLNPKWRGTHIESKRDTHFCKICDTGPRDKLKLETLKSELSDAQATFESAMKSSEMRALVKKVAKYEMHLKQVNNQRDFIKDLELQCQSDPERAVLFRDFVCWYGPDGSKIRTLVFVLLHNAETKYIFNINWGTEAGCDTP
jgi:hypothetical protein